MKRPTLQETIALFVECAAGEIGQDFHIVRRGDNGLMQGVCIAAAAITARVFRALYWPAFEFTTSVLVTAPDGIHQVGVGPLVVPEVESTGQGIDSHLVVLVGGRYLIDASALQFWRPQYNLKLPAVVVCRVPDESVLSDAFLEGSNWLMCQHRGTVAQYRRIFGHEGYRTGPDWSNVDGRLNRAVNAILTYIRRRA